MNTIQSALYTLIQRFVERQSLILEAIRVLRPDWIIQLEHEDDSEFWAKWTPEKWQAFVLDYARRTATGEWGQNKEWEYFLHGHGCRLTHKVTQERIEWDLGSLQTFDKNWFVNYVRWLLNQETDDKAVIIVQEWYDNEKKRDPDLKSPNRSLHDPIYSILDQLHQMGILTQNQQYYTLLSTD